jgi:hypothetical protein
MDMRRLDFIRPRLLAGLLITWLVTFFGTFRSVQSIAAATKFTVMVTWLLLAVLIVFNATLEGATDGMRAYIGEWNLEVLKRGDAWADAAGQIFFTLSITLGAPPDSFFSFCSIDIDPVCGEVRGVASCCDKCTSHRYKSLTSSCCGM